MPIGFYQDEAQRLVSVTSLIDYTLGIADEIDKWSLKQAILAVQKASKTNKLTQEQAIEIGLNQRHQILDTARFRGTQVHQAIQNLHNGLPYELSEEDSLYYASYFNFYKEHLIEPILEEYKVKNHQFGYAGRLDFYGKLDGKYVLLDFKTSKSVRWTYGLQLAAYKECLTKAGYQVDACYVVHIKPKARGTIPKAELHEFKYPFEAVKWLVGLFNLKLANDPYVKWYARTDEAAIEAEKKEADIKSAPGFAPSTIAQGHQPESQDTSPKLVPPVDLSVQENFDAYLNQVDTRLLETFGQAIELVQDLQTNRSNSPQGSQADETSSHRTVTQQGILHEGEVVVFSTETPRILPDPSTPPLERHTLVPRPDDEGYELDTRRIRRQKISE